MEEAKFQIVVLNKNGQYDCIYTGLYSSDEVNFVIDRLKKEDIENNNDVYIYRKVLFNDYKRF